MSDELRAYRVIRFFKDDRRRRRTMITGLTLTEAQAHCQNPETSSSTCTTAKAKRYTQRVGAWFDGYSTIKGVRIDD